MLPFDTALLNPGLQYLDSLGCDSIRQRLF